MTQDTAMDYAGMDYAGALKWIHSISRFGMKPGLQRVRALLERLGNPHHELKFVHIGGTNGKGSTAAMLVSILQAAGYRAGLYTSPYLTAFTNRMSVNGEEVSPAELLELVGRVRPLVEEIAADPTLGHPTEFEVVTVLALAYFARHRPDLVALEVGLGGRLDATNVIMPLLSVITNISLEHTQVLGDTVAAIAAEKAGIIKEGAPLVTAADDIKALEVFLETCRRLHSPAYLVHALDEPVACRSSWAGLAAYGDRGITHGGQVFSYRGLFQNYRDLFIPLLGSHQLCNAATALAALELLAEKGFAVSEAAVRQGLEQTRWPGRLEVLRRDPLVVLDGAHNPAAVTALAAAVPEHFRYCRLILVLGILADKDMRTMLGTLLPLADEVILCRPDIPRAAAPAQLREEIRAVFNGPISAEDNVADAFRLALKKAGREDMVLVTGSLYTVSEARAFWSRQVERT